MGTRRRSGTIRVDVEVEVEPWQVLEEISTEDLLEELASREDKPKSAGQVAAHAYFTIGKLSDWDTESLLEAARCDDGRRAVDLLRRAFH